MKFISLLLFITCIFSQQKGVSNRSKDIITNGEIHANNVRVIVANNGWLFWGGGASGLVIPSPVFGENDGNFGSVFSGGIWFVGTIDGVLKSSIGAYATDYTPGDWNNYHNNPNTNETHNPDYKIYYHYSESHISHLISLLRNEDLTLDKKIHNYAQLEIDKAFISNQEWSMAILQGAPENPPGDVSAFYIYHDSHKAKREENGTNESKSPMNIQVRQLVYQFKNKEEINNTVFVKTEVINKNAVPIKDFYISIWADPDVGQFQDDLMGSDIDLQMMYMYNGQSSDAQYTDVLGIAPPSVGFINHQGPIIDSIGHTIYKLNGNFPVYSNSPIFETSKLSYEIIPDKYIIQPSGAIYQDEDYGNAQRHLNLANNRSGYDGGFFNSQRYALDNGLADLTTVNWVCNGNPSSGLGWIDYNPDDRRMSMNMNKFDLGVSNGTEDINDPGYSSFTFSVLTSFGKTHLMSTNKLKIDAQQIITFYQSGYRDDRILNSPPDVKVREISHEKIQFNWMPNNRELNKNTESESLLGYKFQGYQIVQFDDETKNSFKSVNIYDIEDDIMNISNLFYEPSTFDSYLKVVIEAENLGIPYTSIIDKDHIKDDFLRDNNYYHFGIRAYYHNPTPIDGVNFVKFGPWATGLDSIMPKNIELGTEIYSHTNDEIQVDISNGNSDGKAYVTVFDPYDVTGSNYFIKFKTFQENTYHQGFELDTIQDTIPSGTLGWYLEKDGNQISNLMPQSEDGTEYNYDIYQEGLRIIVTGPEPTFKDFRVTANANGPLDDHAGFAADYNGWPGLGRHNISNQQANGSMWFFGPWHSYQAQSFTDAMPTLDVVGNLRNYVPHDFEWRFTGNGKAYNYWTAPYNVIDVPFEIWDIGTSDGPEDDVKLIPYLLEENDNDIWDYGASDNPMSGSTNDPEMERIYWMAPEDYSHGTSGFDQHIADLESDPNNDYPWAGDQNILSRTSLIWWNGWDVTNGHPNDNLSIVGPEIGTVLKFVTSKVNSEETVFSFTAPQAPKINDVKLAENQFEKNITVFPNPYYGVHSNQADRWDTHITFANLPVIENNDEVVIKIYMINGELVKTLKYDGTSTVIKWDVANDTGRKVRSNLYIAVIKYRSTTVIKKILYFAQEDYYRTH